jgi:glycosyltransferase involved in cell wall biosynthesis
MQGGVGAYTEKLAASLCELGVDVAIFTNELTQNSKDFGETGDIPSAFPQIYPQFSHWRWKTGDKVQSLTKQLQADWVHVQYQTAAFQMHPAINLAPYFWRKHGLKVAWTYHDLLVPYLFPKAGAILRNWITRRPAQDAHITVVTNEGDRQLLAGQARHLAKIPIGSNIEGRSLTPDQRQARRAQLGYGETDLVLGYFGFLNRSKGGLILVETLGALVQAGLPAHLLMIGEEVGASDPTNYTYLQEVKGRVAALGLAQRVQWTGHLPDEAVGRDLNCVDVLLMPYLDGLSLRRGTLMAGLANGCAIVTTHPQAPTPELVDGRDLLLVPAGDAQAAAQAVQRLHHDPSLAQGIRAHARTASHQFHWREIAKAHLALYGDR